MGGQILGAFTDACGRLGFLATPLVAATLELCTLTLSGSGLSGLAAASAES